MEGVPELGDAQLVDHFLDHRSAYRLPETASFTHVFFSSASRGMAGAEAAARAALSELTDAPPTAGAGRGDAPPTPSPILGWNQKQVEDRFGTEFSVSVFAVAPGAWTGPLASAYGHHLVYVIEHGEGRLPEFAEVSGRVAADLDAQQRTGALDALYSKVRDMYNVVIEGEMAGADTHMD
jgi:hypothetical protein